MKYLIQIKAEHFKALGDPTRLKILELLLSHKSILCVCAIAEKLGISQPAVSQHLKILKHAGLVKGTRRGYNVHYTINPETLATFKEHMEKMHKKAIVCCKIVETEQCCPEKKK
jgi:ArsR family transcriptional regulator